MIQYKKKEINIIQFATLLLGLVVMSSCKKFLEEIPPGQMTTETPLTSVEDGEALTLGPYRSLANWTSGAADWGNYLPQTLEFPTGKATTIDSHAKLIRFQNNQVSGDILDDFNNQWKYWYQGVQDCNFSITKLPSVTDMSEADRLRALGEVRTLRAWYYFNIVRYWGDAIMDTSVINKVNEVQLPRTSLKTIYDEVIIPDLEFAVNESGLPDNKSNDGRITRYVARMILADVYLTCAGYPYQEVDKDPSKSWCEEGLWQQEGYPVQTESAKSFLVKAKGQLDALYGKYELGTYHDFHDPAMNNKGGAIFQAQYLANVSDMSGLVACSLPNLSHISMFGDEYGTFVPTLEYYNSYDPADKRIQERQFFFTQDRISKKYDPNEGPARPFEHPHLYKYYDSVAIKITAHSSLNWTFYRYHEVLLDLTEVNWALRKLGVSVSDHDITKGINEVRERADLPPYSVSDVNLLAILSERAYDMIFENKMLWDQRRTRKCLIDGKGKFGIENFIGHRPSHFNFSFSAMNLLSPIPGSEIKTNGACKQNFGYQPRH